MRATAFAKRRASANRLRQESRVPDTNAPTAPQWSAGSGPVALAFTADDETAGAVRRCFTDLALIDARVERAGIEAATGMLARAHSPRILIVDISGEKDPLPKLHRLADVCDPATSVMVVGDRNDVVLYRDLKRLGVAEYFFKPLVPELLERALQSAFAGTVEAPPGRTGKLVVVFGVRGGVGSSTIAVNAAWHLAEELKRHVALLDLDLQGGDVALQLDVEPSHALREALEHPERVDDLLLARAFTKVTERLGVLASLESFREPLIVDDDAALKLIAKLQLRHRYVFVDVPHWAGTRLQRLMNEASMLILVGDASLASAREMARWREQVQSARPDHSIWQILNKAGGPGALPEADFARAIGEPPDAVVRFDSDVAKAGNLGHPALPRSRTLAHGLAPLFKSLAGEAEHEHPSLLARLFQS
jgi:pilus assembly protein CpaE